MSLWRILLILWLLWLAAEARQDAAEVREYTEACALDYAAQPPCEFCRGYCDERRTP